MKSFIKSLKGTLKMALVSYPVVLIAGGVAGITGLLADGLTKESKIRDEVRNTEIVQEIIKEEEEILNLPFEESGLSLKDWTTRKEYLESDKFIDETIKNTSKLAEYQFKKDHAEIEEWCSMIFALPIAIGVIEIVAFYSSYFQSGFTSPCDKLISNAKEDFKEAKELKELSKKQKEEAEYCEETL